MTRIQINDLNSSDFGSLSELTDEEMLGIGGGYFTYDGKYTDNYFESEEWESYL
jgi:hypothetical protein